MAVAEQAVEAILEAASGVTALVGASVYAGKAPQNAGDCVIYQLVSAERQHAMGSDTGLTMSRMQVTSWAKHYSSAKAIAEACRAALQDYTGPVGGVTVQRIFLQMEFSRGYDLESAAYGHHQEYDVWHRE